MKRVINVSVVVPVYNAEKYLVEFMDSLIGQTLEHVQIICVDDCSKDNSYQILQKYQEKYSITIFQNEYNCGAANTRNKGLQLAEGEYVICFDADDVLDRDYLRLLYEAARENNADVAMGYIENFTSDIQEYKKSAFRELRRNMIPTYPILAAPKQFGNLFQILTNGACDKLVRRDNIRNYNIQFQDLPCTNDLAYSFKSVLSANKIVFVDNAQYFNRLEINSSITGRWKNRGLFLWAAMDEVWNFMQTHKMQDALERSFFWEVLKRGYNKCYNCGKDIQSEAVSIFQGYYKKWKMDSYYKEYGISVLEEKLLVSLLKNNIEKSYIDILFDVSEKAITNIMRQYADEKKKVALWGLGKIGQRCWDNIQKQEVRVDFLIDNDIRKQGQYLGKTKIYSYEQIKEQIDIIWVTSHSVYESVKEQIQDELPIVNICSVMERNVLEKDKYIFWG